MLFVFRLIFCFNDVYLITKTISDFNDAQMHHLKPEQNITFSKTQKRTEPLWYLASFKSSPFSNMLAMYWGFPEFFLFEHWFLNLHTTSDFQLKMIICFKWGLKETVKWGICIYLRLQQSYWIRLVLNWSFLTQVFQRHPALNTMKGPLMILICIGYRDVDNIGDAIPV